MIDDPKAKQQIEVGIAFEAMRNFLDAFYTRGGPFPGMMEMLLSSLAPTRSGMPLDRAQWHDFLNAVEQAKRGEYVENRANSERETKH